MDVVRLFLLPLLLAVALSSCAKERELRRIPQNAHRLSKSAFKGNFLYLKSLADVKYPGPQHRDLPLGLYLDSDKIVQFVIRERSLDVVSLNASFQNEAEAERNSTLASFPIVRHVDVMRKLNADGRETHEEEETEGRRPWNERDYMLLDFSEDLHDSYHSLVKTAHAAERIDIDPSKGNIHFEVKRQLKDDTSIRMSYSFSPYQPSSSYQKKEYPRRWQRRFGFFKTERLAFDRYGRLTTENREELLTRWDTSKTVTFHFAHGYPNHLKEPSREAFRRWNAVFRSIIGRDLFVLADGESKPLGTLNDNILYYDDAPSHTHGILAYAPSTIDPSSGEIKKSDVIFYGGTLRRALFHSRLWDQLLGADATTALEMPRALEIAQISDPLTKMPPAEAPKLPDLLEKLQTRYSMEQLSANLFNTTRQNRLSHRSTAISEALFEELTRQRVREMSDTEIETLLYSRLLVHELGHVVGLRHNFEGSTDVGHFHEHGRTSSAMDYGLLLTEEPASPGPYDVAAIRYGYAPDNSAHQQLLDANYLYCTDDEILTSANAWCGKFDTGTTLKGLVTTLSARYYASYALNNLRHDRILFGKDDDDYLRRTTLNLAPIRLLHDYADAAIRANEDDRRDRLWELFRQRIEAGPDTAEADIVEVEVTDGLEIKPRPGEAAHQLTRTKKRLNVRKIDDVLNDAREARNLAVERMIHIILDSGRQLRDPQDPTRGEIVRRTDYDDTDQANRILQRRGVLLDKLIALLLIGSSAKDPVNPGRQISAFGSGYHYLFNSLLSNTVPNRDEAEIGETTNTLAQFDINLREMALFVLKRYLAREGEYAWARELAQMNKIFLDLTALAGPNSVPSLFSAPNAPLELGPRLLEVARTARGTTPPQDSQVAGIVEEFRKQRRALNQAKLARHLSAGDHLMLELRVRELEQARNKISRAYAQSNGSEYYAADVADDRFQMDTASGRLLRDNMNVIEDDLLATIEVRRAFESRTEPTDPQVLQALIRNERLLRAKYSSEKIFAEKLYRLYRLE